MRGVIPQVINARTVTDADSEAVYIGRGSPFGNPFVIGRDGTREEVIKAFENDWYTRSPEHRAKWLRSIKGRDLVCWCAPLPCHGDFLLRLANG